MARAFSTLGRSLLRLGRARANGVLWVDGTRAGLELHGGAVVAYVDRRNHERRRAEGAPLERRVPTRATRAGERRGSKSPEAGLLDQWLTWVSRPLAQVRYVEGSLENAVLIPEPMRVEALVLDAARRLRLETDAARVLSRRWERAVALISLDGLPLNDTERSLLRALEHCPGARGGDLTSIAGGHEALRALCAWTEVGWVAPFRRGGSHLSLLKTTRALRASGGTMPLGRGRRFLRRKAARLHPDRFDERIAPLSRAAMEALLRAAD